MCKPTGQLSDLRTIRRQRDPLVHAAYISIGNRRLYSCADSLLYIRVYCRLGIYTPCGNTTQHSGGICKGMKSSDPTAASHPSPNLLKSATHHSHPRNSSSSSLHTDTLTSNVYNLYSKWRCIYQQHSSSCTNRVPNVYKRIALTTLTHFGHQWPRPYVLIIINMDMDFCTDAHVVTSLVNITVLEGYMREVRNMINCLLYRLSQYS
jgi:hypothetical protein